MVTKQEFKELSERYNTEKYGDSAIITTLNDRVLILNPYYRSDQERYYYRNTNKAFKHHIIEYGDMQIYYGITGKIISGTYEWVSGTDAVFEGDDYLVNLGKLFTTNNYTCQIENIPTLYKNNHYRNFINDLISAEIKIDGLINLVKSISDFKYESLEKTFHIKAKDLRIYSNCISDKKLGDIDIISSIKNTLSCSGEDAISYLPIARVLGLPYQNTTSKINRKKLRNYFDCGKKISEVDSHFLYTYRDYFRMARELNNSIDAGFSLYPSTIDKLIKLHDLIIPVYNREQAKIKVIENKLKQENYEKLFYSKAKELEYSDKTYSIIACKELSDLILEGSTLHHCVGSYINSVSEGKEFILFLRKNNELNVPFYTIDVCGNKVRQIHGDRNCNITKELKPFIEQWATNFKLSVDNCSGVYCALR